MVFIGGGGTFLRFACWIGAGGGQAKQELNNEPWPLLRGGGECDEDAR